MTNARKRPVLQHWLLPLILSLTLGGCLDISGTGGGGSALSMHPTDIAPLSLLSTRDATDNSSSLLSAAPSEALALDRQAQADLLYHSFSQTEISFLVALVWEDIIAHCPQTPCDLSDLHISANMRQRAFDHARSTIGSQIEAVDPTLAEDLDNAYLNEPQDWLLRSLTRVGGGERLRIYSERPHGDRLTQRNRIELAISSSNALQFIDSSWTREDALLERSETAIRMGQLPQQADTREQLRQYQRVELPQQALHFFHNTTIREDESVWTSGMLEIWRAQQSIMSHQHILADAETNDLYLEMRMRNDGAISQQRQLDTPDSGTQQLQCNTRISAQRCSEFDEWFSPDSSLFDDADFAANALVQARRSEDFSRLMQPEPFALEGSLEPGYYSIAPHSDSAEPLPRWQDISCSIWVGSAEQAGFQDPGLADILCWNAIDPAQTYQIYRVSYDGTLSQLRYQAVDPQRARLQRLEN